MSVAKYKIKVKNIVKGKEPLLNFQEYNKEPDTIAKWGFKDLEIEENKPLIIWIDKESNIPKSCPVEVNFGYDYNDNYHTNLIKFQDGLIPKWMILITRNVGPYKRSSMTTVNVTVGDDKKPIGIDNSG